MKEQVYASIITPNSHTAVKHGLYLCNILVVIAACNECAVVDTLRYTKYNRVRNSGIRGSLYVSNVEHKMQKSHLRWCETDIAS